MKKRMAALLFAGIMAASLAGCSSKPAETTAAATEAATEAAAETKAEETAAEEKAAETVKEAAKPDNFPKKNIKIIVPYDAGGGVDITTRILAEAAGKIASGTAHGKGPAAGQEMIQGLLFHRVGLYARHQPVHQRERLPLVVAAHTAASPLPRREHAGMGAEPAAQPAIRQPCPQHAFHNCPPWRPVPL